MMFVTTYTDNGKETHLLGKADFTLCGLDTSGDDDLHHREPKFSVTGRVTCSDCERIVCIVEEYQKLRSRKAKKGE